MYNGLNDIHQQTMHQYHSYMDTSTLANLKITDKSVTLTNQAQIDQQQNLINNHNNSSQNYSQNNELYSSDSPVLITDLDQQLISIKVEQISQDNGQIQENLNDNQYKKTSSVSSKVCKVCGDKSLGYNFSQVTCESCKAFFRRNALRDKNFKCPFTDNCEIDIVTRRFCQKCRLRKCFEIGMKSEWIMSDEEKRRKRLNIEENKKKKRNKQNSFSTPNQSLSSFVTDQNANIQSTNSSSNNSSLQPSQLGPTPSTTIDEFNQIMYDSQIATTYYAQNTNSNFISYQEQQYIQQPEIVNQLVHQHYDQFKQNSDYDSVFNLDMSPQYSSSFNSNTTTGPIDELFDDFTSTQSTYNNLTINTSVDSMHTSMNDVSNNNNSQYKILPIGCSLSDDNVENGDHIELVRITNNSAPSQPPIISRFLKVNCLPDNEMIEFIFEQSISSKLCSNNLIDDYPHTDHDKLSRNEMDLIDELLYATANVGCAMSALTTGQSIPPEKVIFELLRMTDYAVRKSIKVSKKLSLFRSLCEEDQISALKGSSTEIMLGRTIGQYDESTDSIIKHEYVGKPKICLAILKSIREDIYYEHKEMILSFKREIRQDTTLVSILLAILLLQPDRPQIQHRMTMKYIQMTYQDLLKRYIYVNFSKENLTIYNELIQSLSRLRTLNEKYIKTYVQLNSDIITPLLMEVFDFGC